MYIYTHTPCIYADVHILEILSDAVMEEESVEFTVLKHEGLLGDNLSPSQTLPQRPHYNTQPSGMYRWREKGMSFLFELSSCLSYSTFPNVIDL